MRLNTNYFFFIYSNQSTKYIQSRDWKYKSVFEMNELSLQVMRIAFWVLANKPDNIFQPKSSERMILCSVIKTHYKIKKNIDFTFWICNTSLNAIYVKQLTIFVKWNNIQMSEICSESFWLPVTRRPEWNLGLPENKEPLKLN